MGAGRISYAPRPGRVLAGRQPAGHDRGQVLSSRGGGALLPGIIAFAIGFLVLAGIFVAVDRLAPSKAPDHAGMSKPDNGLSVRSVLKSAAPILRDRCGKAARAALAKNGVDPSNGDLGKVIDSYCTCAIDRGVEEMSVSELLAFRLNPAAEPAASKMRNIMQKCQAAAKQ